MDTIEVQIQKFSYGNVQVLKQIQFTVPEGHKKCLVKADVRRNLSG